MQPSQYHSTPPLRVPVEYAGVPKYLRKKQVARKKLVHLSFDQCKQQQQQPPSGLVDDTDLLLDPYKTPPSRQELLKMIRSARVKLASTDNTLIALDKFVRHLQMQFDSLYTRKLPKSCARDHAATDTAAAAANTAVATRCKYTADMDAIQKSLTVDPIFEDLLVNRNAWSKEADGVHGESMAIFSSAHMDVVGFTDDEYNQHSRNYLAFIRDIDEGVDPGMAKNSDPLHRFFCLRMM